MGATTIIFQLVSLNLLSLFCIAKAILKPALPIPQVPHTTAPICLLHLPLSSLTLTPQLGWALPVLLPYQVRSSLWDLMFIALSLPHWPSRKSPQSWPVFILLFFAQTSPPQKRFTLTPCEGAPPLSSCHLATLAITPVL